MTQLVRVPLRLRELVDVEAPRTRELVVYCPSKRRSVDASVCASCPSLRGMSGAGSDGSAPALVCAIPLDRASQPPPVGALATPEVVCVTPDVPVTDLPEIFARERAPVLPVVDRSGALLGVVWRSDVAQRGRAAARDDAEAIAYALGPTARTRTDRAPAISETSSLGEAAKAMARLGVRALVVVDESGRVVGLLSDVALLRAFATARAPHP